MNPNTSWMEGRFILLQSVEICTQKGCNPSPKFKLTAIKGEHVGKDPYKRLNPKGRVYWETEYQREGSSVKYESERL